MSKNKKVKPMCIVSVERKCSKCGITDIKFIDILENGHTIIQIDEPFVCDRCQELEQKYKPQFYVPTLDDISPKLEQVDENNDKDNDNDCKDKIWEQFKLIEDKCDKTPIKPIEMIVDGTQYSFKCGEIDPNGNYFSVARNPNKCPICDKEYTDSEFICAIEHGTIQLKNICVDCYNKIFKGGK